MTKTTKTPIAFEAFRNKYGWQVAIQYNDPKVMDFHMAAPNEAIARKVAAVDDLLAACKDAVAALDRSTTAMYISDLDVNAMRAAIAKAEGDTQCTRPTTCFAASAFG
jgi:hypothetical protein